MRYFSRFGGQYVPEILIPALEELEKVYRHFKKDRKLQKELKSYLYRYAGRPTPLYFARNLSRKYGKNIYLKREDLLHTGAHKINNTLGQAMLARVMGKKRVIAETGAGQHGVAVSTAAALFGLDCVVYMGKTDMARQYPNVERMKILGTKVCPVTSGSQTLKDAVNEALRDWITNVRTTHYILGSVVGPHPFPTIVRDFQTIIGKETKTQFRKVRNKLPDYIIACVGGGSNAAGIFYPFINTSSMLIGVQAAGLGLSTGKHSAPLLRGRIGYLHGNKTYVLQHEGGQIAQTHSISAGLDYPGIGPEHAYWHATGNVHYASVTDKEALAAFLVLSRYEGIIPALESAHALAYALKLRTRRGAFIVVNLSGRGDKDLETVMAIQGGKQ